MKFITEDELRILYRNAPFAEYRNREGCRLTPGGRQFLLDRGVKIAEPPVQGDSGRPVPVICGPDCRSDERTAVDSEQQRAKLALATARACFLQTGADLLDTDVLMAQQIFALQHYLNRLIGGDEKAELPDYIACTGLNRDNYNLDNGTCFEINGFHVQTEKGREIAKLHYLRCLLMEQQPWLTGVYEKGINGMINCLSQMICGALGGTICQRMQ